MHKQVYHSASYAYKPNFYRFSNFVIPFTLRILLWTFPTEKNVSSAENAYFIKKLKKPL